MIAIETKTIYCTGCKRDVPARLTNGEEIYPHRRDLYALPFWKCDTCGNYVGCHHQTGNPTRPLGVIPTKELRAARNRVHARLDPLWKGGKWKRGKLYAMLSGHLGYEFHTAEIKSVADADSVLAFLELIEEPSK